MRFPTAAGQAGSPGQRLAQAFQNWSNDDYGGTGGNPFRNWTGDAIVWLARDHPNFGGQGALPVDNWQDSQIYWDVPKNPTSPPIHIELKLVYWAPLQIPFADWVFSRAALASLGLMSYTAGNPLMETQNANWTAGAPIWAVTGAQAALAPELMTRVAAGHYAFPIVVTYSMRMMSPVKLGDYPPFGGTQNCLTTPASLY